MTKRSLSSSSDISSTSRLVQWVGVFAVGALACTGGVSSGPGGSPGMGGSTSGTGGAGGAGMVPPGTMPPPADFVPAPAGLRRLTVPQYMNAVRDLFGDAVMASLDPEVVAVLPLSGFASIGASLLSLSRPAVEHFETVALDLGKKALANQAERAAFVGCAPAGVTDDNCTRSFLKKFGRRAWRRTLTDDEVAPYVAAVNTIQKGTNDFHRGLEYGIAGILQSPNFLYRVELGSADPMKPSRVIFSDFELATRLSFFLWNTTPDDQLLDAAEMQQLTKGTGFATHSKRLLESPRTVAAMQEFFSEYYRLSELDRLPADVALYPLKTATIGASMREETIRFLTDIALTRNADYRDIFDSRSTFVNADLAKIYGLPAPASPFAAVTLPEAGLRRGYLGQGSFLALNAHTNVTSATLRGKFIMEMLLCQDIPPPPDNIPPLPEDNTATGPRTMRQKLEVHRANEPCKTCHAAMDPMGLAFENFDAIGAFRTMDAGQTIDASGEIEVAGKKVPFAGPRELAAALRGSPDVAACVAKNLYRYALGHVDTPGEAPAIDVLSKGFTDGGFKFRGLMDGVVKSSGFVYAAPAPATVPSGSGGAAGTGGMGGAAGSGGSGGAGGNPDGGAPDVPGVEVRVAPPMPSYATHVAPIIAVKCAPCHTTEARAGFNWTYANLVTNSTVTNSAATCGPGEVPDPGLGGNAPRTCLYMEGNGRRVTPGASFETSLLYIKIVTEDGRLCDQSCGQQMPPINSGKSLTTYERDVFINWMKTGAMP